eukprot:TRINITY_DN32623_c0_g1_i1.p1 TRINITY_DN32623_c0_g1~~TRINITY_DN32623_c0_g1_i1.p1  ORF type:complete len:524 (-),score=119.59 TRINITY_DN32623_c0_g1_i1:28-1599(-)
MQRLARSWNWVSLLQHRAMSSSWSYYNKPDRSYAATQEALLSLQHKGEELKQIIRTREEAISQMQEYLDRAQASQAIKDLSFIHIAGTKGKGSTSAFTESILRHKGLKTGLYTSPHLVSVRERYRINGTPVSEELFTKYFWDTWEPLYQSIVTAEDDDSKSSSKVVTGMPGFFKFLTIMAFKLFLGEKVDVVVLEVGIGGRLDPTNVIPHPVVTGVTALGFDHMEVLGNELWQIAREKGGIYKAGIPAFSVEQPQEALEQLKKSAEEAQVELFQVVPALKPTEVLPRLGLQGEFQWQNAGLAVALSSSWLRLRSNEPLPDFAHNLQAIVDEDGNISEGLKNCQWPGRCQVVQSSKFPNAKFFLDGAHTQESMLVATQWMESVFPETKTTNVLIISCSNNRNPFKIFNALASSSTLQFDMIITCPFDLDRPTVKEQLPTIKDLTSGVHELSPDEESKLDWQDRVLACWKLMEANNNRNSQHLKFSSIEESLEFVSKIADTSNVFVTGSLYLVGGVLGRLQDSVQ